MELRYAIKQHRSPIIATAIHDGHLIDTALHPFLNLQEHERFREEDPYTNYLVEMPVSWVSVQTSRFQVDLNRERSKAVYRLPEDAWGLQVWNTNLPDRLIADLQRQYDLFYAQIARLLETTIKQFGHFVVLDVHSYNHRRGRPEAYASTGENPEINVGTRHNRNKWQMLSRDLIRFLSHQRVKNHRVDIRENIKFGGGGFAAWINRNYGKYGCVLSIEFKKTFMDEWTGRVDIQHLRDLKWLLEAAVQYLLDALENGAKRT